jgi:glycosyltransferase involved in cell wall biosynthesis
MRAFYDVLHSEPMARPHILIVSPASARENNGNWQTASRWMRFLAARATRHDRAGLGRRPGGARPADRPARAPLRRGAGRLRQAHPGRPSLLVLTGTDLYRDIHQDAGPRAPRWPSPPPWSCCSRAAWTNWRRGARQGPRDLPVGPALRRPAPHAGSCDVAMIGHLRDEKDPLTFMRAAALVTAPGRAPAARGRRARPGPRRRRAPDAGDTPRYRWLGALPHMPARRLLRRCRAMAICSRMEGGANVIIEAVTSGVPVLASDMSGNRGMLGEDYAGYFAPGDAAALARLIDRVASTRLRESCCASARRGAGCSPRAGSERRCSTWWIIFFYAIPDGAFHDHS